MTTHRPGSGGSAASGAGSGEPDPPGSHPPGSSPVPFPPALVSFVRLFNRGLFWKSHEALEGAWRKSGSEFYHGLILLASACVHATRENPRGVAAQLRKAREALEPGAPAYLGVDVESLLARAREWLGARAPGAPAAPSLRIDLDPRRVRGDEPELREGPGRQKMEMLM